MKAYQVVSIAATASLLGNLLENGEREEALPVATELEGLMEGYQFRSGEVLRRIVEGLREGEPVLETDIETFLGLIGEETGLAI